tara:strand:+ start:22519 stop:22668 length:150 start_codon:yes stop_codon:yes gene_type:complete
VVEDLGHGACGGTWRGWGWGIGITDVDWIDISIVIGVHVAIRKEPIGKE